MRLRKIPGCFVRRVQSFESYRKIVRGFCPRFVIREAAPVDRAFIEARFNLKIGSPQQLTNQGVTNFVACRKRKIIGFAQLAHNREFASLFSGFWLFSLHISPLYRGMGIGAAMICRVMERARTENARELSLLVFADNQAALRMYAKLEFARIIIPELEEKLEHEKASSGRRRIVLRRKIC
jgi:ribosomal protein S18 acetylase RimI-like enzyme